MGTAAGLSGLLGALGTNSLLRSLDAGGNELVGGALNTSYEDALEVAAGLGAAGSLRDLHLWRCGLSDVAVQLVVDAQPPSLTLLNLASNPCSPDLRKWLACRQT